MTILAASTLLFDDSEKQTKYETISFDEVYAEVVELKVVTFIIKNAIMNLSG